MLLDLQQVHASIQASLEALNAHYKWEVDFRCRDVHLEVGDYVYVFLTKDRVPTHDQYNKLSSRKIILLKSSRKSIKMLTGYVCQATCARSIFLT